ncbi:zinc transport protein [Escherichia coli]|nr:zinc transport protein [Escherichia coli]
MEAIKGSDVNVPDAVFAWMLDGRGGVKPLENTDVIDEAHPCWLHLNYVHHDSAQWLATTPLLPNNVRDALAGESTRPRVSRLGEGTLITLRCINGSTDERPDQLVAMRVYMDGRLIVSTRQRKVLALDDVVSDLEEGTGPTDCGGWLVDVCDALTDHSSEFIEQLHDKIIDLEDNLLDQQIPPRGFLALLRKQLIVMRRYMAPQRDVYARLASERLPWMSDDQRRRMQDIADRLGRGLDEIDACIARTGVMADENRSGDAGKFSSSYLYNVVDGNGLFTQYLSDRVIWRQPWWDPWRRVAIRIFNFLYSVSCSYWWCCFMVAS